MIEVNALTYNIGEFNLNVKELRITDNEFVFLVGLNGSGKTTLLNLLSGLLPVNSGNIKINGLDIRKLNRINVAEYIAFVEQESELLFPYTVFEAVLMGRYAANKGKFFYRDIDVKVVKNILRDMDLLKFADRIVNTLSGGEKRRVELARALAQDAPILLMDEPLTFLDIRQQEIFISLILKLHEEMKKTIICVSHNVNFIKKMKQRTIVLNGGEIIADIDKNKSFDEYEFFNILEEGYYGNK